MTRIATAVLIVVAVLAFNGGLLRGALAEDTSITRQLMVTAVKAPPQADRCETRSARVLSLLLCLEALRQAPQALTPAKE
jgi:hypothetical protein